MYRTKGLKHLVLEQNDYLKYLDMSVSVTQAAQKFSGISGGNRIRLLRHTIELVQQKFQESGVSKEIYDRVSTLVETSITLLCGDKAGYLLLESLKDISDEVYAYANGVTMVAGMIGHVIGWRSAKTLNKVALAGMLRDLVKKQHPLELAKKSKTKMTADEIILYQTHSKRGREILSDLDCVPSDVIQAVYQHHERGNGTGFHARLLDAKI